MARRVVQRRRRAHPGIARRDRIARHQRTARHGARRQAGDRLRRRRVPSITIAAAGTRRARCRRVPARLSDPGRDPVAVPRYKLTIEYDGAGLVGWQRQANGMSVQEALETAFLRFCGERLTVFGAGRTDAGVHALAQVAHVDLARAADPDTIRSAVNHHLRPHTISLVTVMPALPGFNARLSARSRLYLYRILNRRAPPAFERGRGWHAAPPRHLRTLPQGG